jgi:hypothetical protein
MPFVKLDCQILRSTLWAERLQRELFITALLLAEPYSTDEPMDGIQVRTLDPSGFTVPAGEYGFCHAAGVGIIRLALCNEDEGELREKAYEALEALCAPDPESRSQKFEGRRLQRVNGGYVVLNFADYRDKDHTAAERMKRYRQRRKAVHGRPQKVTGNSDTVTCNVTEAESRDQSADKPPTPGLPFQSPDFDSAWDAWVKHRQEIRKKLTPSTVAAQMAKLKAMGEGSAVASIYQSIENGWTGLFEPKGLAASAKPIKEIKCTNDGASPFPPTH